MLVLGMNEGERVTITLEDGRKIYVYPKLRKVGTKTMPPRFGIAVDAPKSVRIDRIKESDEEKES